jgi:peptidoglycan biosynthesis protein MviN/MurJ (putative lipid II flippase)
MPDFKLILELEFKRLLRGIIVLLTNLIMAATTILAIWALDLLFQSLWRDQDPHLFGTVSLKYILYTTDLAVLLLFLLNGVLETYRLFSDRTGRQSGKFRGSGK